MATGEQVKALIKAHYDQDNERFKTAALRIAASETRIGHTTLGREITAMIDASTRTKGNIINLANKDNLFLRLREFVWVEITSPPPFPAALVSGPST